MRWLKRLAWLVVAGLLVVAVGVGIVFATHPRDEDAFRAHVADRPRLAGQPERSMQRGDAACDWLDTQYLEVVEQPGLDLSLTP